MHKLGLKVWSTNELYIEPAIELYSQKVFDYLELYVVPGSAEKYLQRWEDVKIPIILHAPNSYGGLNFSLNRDESKNRGLIKEVEIFRKALNPQTIIFHPGTNGSVEETIRQIQIFKNEWCDLFNSVVLENKPKIGLKGEICIGASPEEIKKALNETGLGFCYDFGHSNCYAVWKKVDYRNVIDQFIELNPRMYHLSDGDISSETDMHLNYGKGNFDLKEIISRIPDNASVSIETSKKSKIDLDDFKDDAEYFRRCAEMN